MARTKSAEAAVQEKSGTEVNSSTEAKENGAVGGNKAKKGKETSTYTVEEFVKAADSVFGKHYSPDIIRAAMKVAGKNRGHQRKRQRKLFPNLQRRRLSRNEWIFYGWRNQRTSLAFISVTRTQAE